MLGKILIKRLGIIPVKKSEEITQSKKVTFLAGCAGLGYEFKNTEIYNDSVLEISSEIIETLEEIRGANVGKVPLFQDFPENTPDDQEYFEKRVLGFVGNFVGLFQEGRELENGIIVPEWLFDIEEYGADPITQFQNQGLFEKALERQKSKDSDIHIEWQMLEFLEEEQAIEKLKEYLKNILYSKSSIKESLHQELEFLLDYFGVEEIEIEKIVFKEIQAFVSKFLWKEGEFGALKNLIKTPTDLLRLFAILTNTDISLATKIKFPKFKRAERRFILGVLEESGDLSNDFYKYSELWKALGEYLHPGEYARRYSKTFTFFKLLREGKIETFDSRLQKSLNAGEVEQILSLLIPKPGILARKLHEILEVSGNDNGKVLKAFEKVGEKVELKNLLVMRSYFQTIEDSEYRTVINKKGNIKILENKKNRLEKDCDKKVVVLLGKHGKTLG